MYAYDLLTLFVRIGWTQFCLGRANPSTVPLTPPGIISTDAGFKRLATKNEFDQGIPEPKEKCLPHFISDSLIALSVHWDYVMDLKASN